MLLNAILLFLSVLVIISIKPYIFVALAPALVIWAISSLLSKIRSILVRILVTPVVAVVGIAFGALLWIGVEQMLGDYSDIDSMMQKAYVSQQDLKREAYQGNSFDIGDFEPTLPSILSKFPEATFAGMYRPHILEANNIVMLISALENSALLALSALMIIALIVTRLKPLSRDPVVLFSILFTVVFAFSVGLSTSNFGALVRFKIPMTPFLLSAIFICMYRAGFIAGARTSSHDSVQRNNGEKALV